MKDLKITTSKETRFSQDEIKERLGLDPKRIVGVWIDKLDDLVIVQQSVAYKGNK